MKENLCDKLNKEIRSGCKGLIELLVFLKLFPFQDIE